MSSNKEKQEKKLRSVVKDLNLKLVRPVSTNEINQLKVLLKEDIRNLWKYLQKKD